MPNQVKGVNGKDFIVKAHPRHKYLITDYDLEIICKLRNLSFCIYSLCRHLSYNQLQNLSAGLFENCVSLTWL